MRELRNVNEYQLADCIGKGAFGSVFKALNMENGETVAIKLVSLSNIPKSELGLIMMEIDLLKKLKHPNIVKYNGFVKTKDHLNIILEYCENGSLTSIVKKFGKFPENLVAVYIVQVLEGLRYLHEQGVIHRDIKGANILTTKEGLVKLADFGVATRGPTADATGDGGATEVAGSPYWMAPEIIELSGATTASDVWSVGCTVIELFQGVPPYHDLAPMPALFRIVQDDHPPIPEGASSTLKDFLMQCFQKDCNLRVSAKKLLKHPWIQNARRRADTLRQSHGAMATVNKFAEDVKTVQLWNAAINGADTMPLLASKIRQEVDVPAGRAPRELSSLNESLDRPTLVPSAQRAAGRGSIESNRPSTLGSPRVSTTSLDDLAETVRMSDPSQGRRSAVLRRSLTDLADQAEKDEDCWDSDFEIGDGDVNLKRLETLKKPPPAAAATRQPARGPADAAPDSERKHAALLNRDVSDDLKSIDVGHEEYYEEDMDEDDNSHTILGRVFPKQQQQQQQQQPQVLPPRHAGASNVDGKGGGGGGGGVVGQPGRAIAPFLDTAAKKYVEENEDDVYDDIFEEDEEAVAAKVGKINTSFERIAVPGGLKLATPAAAAAAVVPKRGAPSGGEAAEAAAAAREQEARYGGGHGKSGPPKLRAAAALPLEEARQARRGERAAAGDLSKSDGRASKSAGGDHEDRAPPQFRGENRAVGLGTGRAWQELDEEEDQGAATVRLPPRSATPQSSKGDRTGSGRNKGRKKDESLGDLEQYVESDDIDFEDIWDNRGGRLMSQRRRSFANPADDAIRAPTFHNQPDDKWPASDGDEEDDPFADLEEELDETDLEKNLARDKHARLCADIDAFINKLSPELSFKELVAACDGLITILTDNPALRSNLNTNHGLLPILGLLEQGQHPPPSWKTPGELREKLLRIVNMITGSSTELLENFCLIGGVPCITSFASREHPPAVRLEAARFVRRVCEASTLSLQMFVSGRGLRVLAAFMTENYRQHREFVFTAVNGVTSVFDLQGLIPKNDFCRLLANCGILQPLARTLTALTKDPTEDAGRLIARVVGLLVVFSQSDTKVKEMLGTRRVIKCILQEVDNVASPQTLGLVKCIKNLSMLPTALDILEKQGTISTLTKLLYRKEGPFTTEIRSQVLNALYNLCRLNRRRQIETAQAGAIPALQLLVLSNSPFKQFALPILCDMVHAGSQCRNILREKGDVSFYLGLLSDPYWQVNALEAVNAWLSDEDDREHARIANKLAEPASLDLLSKALLTARSAGLEKLLEQVYKLIMKARKLGPLLLARQGVLPRICEKLDAPQAQIRLGVLRMVSSVAESSVGCPGLAASPELRRKVKKLASDDPGLLVRELSAKVQSRLWPNEIV